VRLDATLQALRTWHRSCISLGMMCNLNITGPPINKLTETKQCPNCKRENKATAVVCRYCYSTVDRGAWSAKIRASAEANDKEKGFVPASCSLRTYLNHKENRHINRVRLRRFNRQKAELQELIPAQDLPLHDRFIGLARQVIAEGVRTGATKECPNCKRENNARAVVCRYCYSTMDKGAWRAKPESAKERRFVPASCSLHTYLKYKQNSHINRVRRRRLNERKSELKELIPRQEPPSDDRLVGLIPQVGKGEERNQRVATRWPIQNSRPILPVRSQAIRGDSSTSQGLSGIWSYPIKIFGSRRSGRKYGPTGV